MGISADFQTHLDGGHTTLARCWQILRKDGVLLGFTDHDNDLNFADTVFRADTGLTALALDQSTGLSVDNSEALGALSDASIQDVDIEAGRFDSAKVTAWVVNWADVAQRRVVFRGSIGEIQRGGGGFRAELRGLTDPLNQPSGRVFQKPCTAVLGDTSCQIDLGEVQNFADVVVEEITEQRVLRFGALTEYAEGWFDRGRLDVLSGAAAGLTGVIKQDRFAGPVRRVELWAPIKAQIAVGDQVRLIAGCDKRFATCRFKFGNHLNFQGFPDVPGDEWISTLPRDGEVNDGGSLRS
ncbi:DUF2163 domain-containing protein [Cognatishimia sp. WU-CL00825]|uniref:DUF2163 domain-containing protein n=1 Tax=Cognatishimia sp. WU-CL00825 TaxID=3127658 RepID=UPI003108BA58